MAEKNPKRIYIRPKSGRFNLNIKELWRYRDLIALFVRRTFVAQYKQTILGPAWAIIQPLFTTVIFTVVFGNVAKLDTGSVPHFVFYMCSNVLWCYFSSCLTTTANTFTANSAILGKVYFPRLVMPVSSVISGLISYAIQMAFFLIIWAVYLIRATPGIHATWALVLVPLMILETSMLGLGCGVIISALTTKYRDLAMLVNFGVQLWMYASPVAYGSSQISGELKKIFMLNPMAPILDTYRYAFFGGEAGIPYNYLIISACVTVIILFTGIALFSIVEKTFTDTI